MILLHKDRVKDTITFQRFERKISWNFKDLINTSQSILEGQCHRDERQGCALTVHCGHCRFTIAVDAIFLVDYCPSILDPRQIYHRSTWFPSKYTIKLMVYCVHLTNLVSAGWLWRINNRIQTAENTMTSYPNWCLLVNIILATNLECSAAATWGPVQLCCCLKTAIDLQGNLIVSDKVFEVLRLMTNMIDHIVLKGALLLCLITV